MLFNLRTLAIGLTCFSLGCSSFSGPGAFRGNAGISSLDEKSNREPAALIAPKHVLEWPVDRARLTQEYSLQGKRPHYGIDLAGPRGTPIVSAGDGIVIYAGKGFRGYGRLVIIEHDNNYATFYSHLDNFKVREGDQVVKGDLLGGMGKSGNARGVHLHFEVRRDRLPIDPMAVLPAEAPIQASL